MKRAAVAAAVVWSAVLVAWGTAAAQEVPAVPVPPTPPAAPAAEKQGLPSMKPEGTLFLRYWYMVQDREKEDPGVDEPHANSFELWRGYFGARGQLLPWLTFRFTSDVGAEKTPKTSEAAAHVHGTGAADETTEAAGDHTHAVAAETRYELFVKYAWLQAELTDGLSLRAGVVDNPYHEFVDRYWGCRYVSRNAGDEFGLWNTADVGGYLRYAVGDKLGEVALGMVNGGGYKQAADTDENKNLWFYAMFTPFRPLGGMGERLSFGAWTEHTLVFSEHLDHPTVMSAFAGYKDSWVTLGYDLLARRTYEAKSDAAGDRERWGLGHGVYLRLDTPWKVGLLGRYSQWRADLDDDASYTTNVALAGLSYAPASMFSVALSGVYTWFSVPSLSAEDPHYEDETQLLLSTQLTF